MVEKTQRFCGKEKFNSLKYIYYWAVLPKERMDLGQFGVTWTHKECESYQDFLENLDKYNWNLIGIRSFFWLTK